MEYEENNYKKLKKEITELRQLKTEYEDFFMHAPDMFIKVDVKTAKILNCNKTSLNMLGYTADEIIGKSIFAMYAPKSAARAREKIFPLFQKTGEIYGEEMQVRRKDGTIIDVSLNISAMRDNKGNIIKSRSIWRNISDNKRIKDTLHAAQQMLRLVLDSIPVSVFWKDKNLQYLGGNKTFLNDAGFEFMEDIIGKTDYDLPWTKEEADSFREADREVIESGTAKYNIIEPYKRSDGSQAWAKTNKVPLLNPEGKVIGVLGTYEDITELKKTEEFSYKTQKLESLGILAGGIAHDFNNLLASIFGHIEMAKDNSKNHEIILNLNKALSTIDRARSLTKQLLTFAKGGAPKCKLQNLFPFVRKTVQFTLSGSNISCIYNIDQNLWPCNFDKNQMEQVIDNLVINAKQAMPLGGTIEISAKNVFITKKEHVTLPKGNYIMLSIKDNGVGISGDILPHIFDPFFTLKAQGSGLGLTTCFSIIKRHKGTIEVKSNVGKGSTFEIYLPAALAKSESPVKNKDVAHRGSGRILLMDDEEIVREMMATMLEKLGYSVIKTKQGKEALSIFKEGIKTKYNFDMVILDLTVPGEVGGKETAREIRKIDRRIPIFVVSGYANDPVLANPHEYGFTAAIQKPFRKSELETFLNKHVHCNPDR